MHRIKGGNTKCFVNLSAEVVHFCDAPICGMLELDNKCQ